MLTLSKALQLLEPFKIFARNRILVVDDEEFCLSSMKALLQKAGADVKYQVDFRINGQECFD